MTDRKPNRSGAQKPVLIVLHQEHSTPGRVGHALTRLGVPLDVRRPKLGDALPETMEQHAGAVVFGGPNSANDEDEFIGREIDWMSVPLAERKPLLGICLGAQMLARNLGSRVFCHVDQRAEVGYYPIHPTAQGRALVDAWPECVYQWHREGFDLPSGAEMLAEGSEAFPVQAFRYGPAAYAVQFHPEVTYLMSCRWTVRGHSRMDLPGAKPRPSHFADRAVYDHSVRTWLKQFLDQWLNENPSGMAQSAPLRERDRAVAVTQAGAVSPA